ncbi:YbjQ family protein [Luteolibacter marinus]|uniref:YbjQ family protein n=1 Tax=Luteolibacter marinus TaxID=2776705 RepID=UPI00186957E9|nr:YbjQ family protein [Luteolibacter marinus]
MTIPGRDVLESKGVVFGEAILGANVFRDIMASVRDVVGGRSGAYESKLREGRKIAVREMVQEAVGLGADAVVGIDIDYESMGQNMMMMVCASGTAVTLKPATQ